jgi:glycosyltransferase involved in cell wall biosynthesis
VDAGRDVTLISVRANLPRGMIDPRVQLVVDEPQTTDGEPWEPLLMRIEKNLPDPLRKVARLVYVQCVLLRNRVHPDPHGVQFFRKHTPQRDYNAIHCHDLNTLPVGLALKRKLAPNAKIIYDSHELFPYQMTNHQFVRYWSRIERNYISQTDAIITINESIARIIAETYGIATPDVIYNSHDSSSTGEAIDRDTFLHRFGAEADGFNVLFQGSLGDSQNLSELVKAFGYLDQSYRLLLIGTGPAEATLRQICCRQKLTNVFFGGWIEQEQLMHYTPHADLGIIPYQDQPGLLNATYCTPNKLFEFIEAQLPIYASDLPELKNIVAAHGIGDAYDLSAAEQIADAIRDCRNRIAAGEFSLASREVARREFSWKAQACKLLEIYERFGI